MSSFRKETFSNNSTNQQFLLSTDYEDQQSSSFNYLINDTPPSSSVNSPLDINQFNEADACLFDCMENEKIDVTSYSQNSENNFDVFPSSIASQLKYWENNPQNSQENNYLINLEMEIKEEKEVLYNDTMFATGIPNINFTGEDTSYELAVPFKDVLLKSVVNKYEENVDNDELMGMEEEILNIKRTTTINNININNLTTNNYGEVKPTTTSTVCLNEIEYDLNNGKIIETTIKNFNNNMVMGKRKRKVPTELKLNIPKKIQRIQNYEQKTEVNTPEITNEILDLEENFNILKYIDEDTTADIIIESPIEEKPLEILEYEISEVETATTSIPTISPQFKNTRSSISSTSSTFYENPSSVQSTISDDSYSPAPTPKRRGRPPKTSYTMPHPAQCPDMSESEFKHLEMRVKNNEASRRSRMNRKNRENVTETEAQQLERRHKELVVIEQKLIKKVAIWKAALMENAKK